MEALELSKNVLFACGHRELLSAIIQTMSEDRYRVNKLIGSSKESQGCSKWLYGFHFIIFYLSFNSILYLNLWKYVKFSIKFLPNVVSNVGLYVNWSDWNREKINFAEKEHESQEFVILALSEKWLNLCCNAQNKENFKVIMNYLRLPF